jgi:hypothetical protein
MNAANAPEWDRFARWRPWPARIVLAALLVILVSAVFTKADVRSKVKTAGFTDMIQEKQGFDRPRDDDLALYDVAIARIGRGENYYDFIVEEHRRAHYPVRPGLAVRLPTLAYLDAWLGKPGQIAAAILLLAATMLAWWRRLGEEPGGREHRPMAMALLAIGTSLGLNVYFFTLHELWAGMLLALAFGLHRPGRKWVAALAVTALALAIREHALPFVLLMAAIALWRRDWKEGAAWAALAAVFLVLLAVHLGIVARHVLPSDPPSAPWLVLRGLTGWLSNVVLSSNLRFLPMWLAGPLVILMVVGWAGWRSPTGTFGFLFYAGYAVAFMLAGRADNYYWGMMVAPAIALGLAFAPIALRSLWRAASARGNPA